MKKRVQIVGFSRKTGKSAKTGKQYDFTEIHFVYPEDGVVGEKACSGVVDTAEIEDLLDGCDLNPDKLPVVDCVFHYQNGRVFIDAIL